MHYANSVFFRVGVLLLHFLFSVVAAETIKDPHNIFVNRNTASLRVNSSRLNNPRDPHSTICCSTRKQRNFSDMIVT